MLRCISSGLNKTNVHSLFIESVVAKVKAVNQVAVKIIGNALVEGEVVSYSIGLFLLPFQRLV